MNRRTSFAIEKEGTPFIFFCVEALSKKYEAGLT